jgi:hypothetical protein
MVPYAPGAAPAHLVGPLPMKSGAPPRPTRRNALMTFLLPLAVMFGGVIVCTILAALISWAFSLLSILFVLAGTAWYVLLAIQMVNEVKAVTRNEAFAWWPILIPIYHYYWMWILVPQEVTKAKQMLGVQQPTRSIVLYIFLFNFAFASDVNDMVR